MKIENESKVEKKIVKRQAIRLDKEDIKELVLKKLREEGFETKDCTIAFNAKFSYVEDEWGMNRTPRAEFVDIVVNL